MDSHIIPLFDARAWASAIALWALCWSAGGLPLIGWRGARGLDRVLLRCALGAPLAALAFLIVGPPGAMLQFPWRALVPLLIAAEAAVRFVRRRKAKLNLDEIPQETSTPPREPISLLGAAGWALTLILLLAALGPALSPPLNYDVLEYHLAVVPHWFRTGEFAPIPRVFYSAQPLGMESLYGLAAVIEGLPRGLSSGLVQWVTFVISALLVNSAARSWGVRRAMSPWLAALFMCHPILFKIQLDRLTDIAGALFVLAGARLAADESLSPKRAAIVLGLLAGGAVATKWTNAATAAIPLMAFVIWRARDRNQPAFARSLAADLARFAGAAACVMAPWCLYLWGRVNNPFAPFAVRWFRGSHWGERNLNYLLETHGAVTPLQADYWLNLFHRLTSFTTGPPLLAMSLLILSVGIAISRRHGGAPLPRGRSATLVVTIALAAGLAFLAWGRLKAAEPRFLAPIYALSILALGAALTELVNRINVARSLVNFGIPIILCLIYTPRQLAMLRGGPYYDRALNRISDREFLKWGLGGATVEFFEAVNRLGPEARTLVLCDARSYYFTGEVRVASVFDDDILRDAPFFYLFTHLAVNEFEGARLIAFHPPPGIVNDPALRALRGQGPPAYGEIAHRWRAYLGIGAGGMDPRLRGRFLEIKRREAIWMIPPDGRYPAMWIAPLPTNGPDFSKSAYWQEVKPR